MPAWKISHKPKPEDRGARRSRTVAISNLFGIIFSLDYECTSKNKGVVATIAGTSILFKGEFGSASF